MTYFARTSGWVAGKRVLAGEPVELTTAQAQYEPVDLAPKEQAPTPSKRKAKREVAA